MLGRIIGLVLVVVLILLFVVLSLFMRSNENPPSSTAEPTELVDEPSSTPNEGPGPIPLTLTPSATPFIPTPSPSATPETDLTLTFVAIPSEQPPVILTPAPTETPQPTVTVTTTPTPITNMPLPPLPPLPPGNICMQDVQDISSPTNGFEYSDDRTYIELRGSAAWPADREGQFLKYEVFYYDPGNQKHDLAEVWTSVSGGLLHRQAFGPLVHQYGEPGWYTFGVLGIGTDSNHFPLGSYNEGCFVRVYLPWPR